MANRAPAPNRRGRFPLGAPGGFACLFCAPPRSSAAVGEARRLVCESTPVNTKLEEISKIVVTICLCACFGCQSVQRSQSSSTFSDLPPEPPKLAPGEVPSSQWSAAIRSLKPIKVYWDVGNLVVVQRVGNGVESGKYIIEPTSSHAGHSGSFIRFTPVAAEGFSPLTTVYDYERSQP